MSSGQKRRIPANYPHMKYRAAKRHARTYERVWFGTVPNAPWVVFPPSAVAQLARTLDEFVRAFRRAFESVDWPDLSLCLESWRPPGAAHDETQPAEPNR